MELHIDTRALSRLSRALRKVAPAIVVEQRAGLRAAGEIVAAEGRIRADYSSRIPNTIRVRTTQGGRVSVIAGGPQALDAVVLEHGGLAGTFRHPVFGNRDVWVDQDARPFLHPAAEAKGEEARAAVAEVISRTIRLLQVEAA